MDGNYDWDERGIRQAGLSDSTANGIVQQCKSDYIVENIEAKCYIDDGTLINDMTSIRLKGGNNIKCWLTMYNNNNSNTMYFDNLLWSIQLKMTWNDYSYYPIKVKIYLDDSDNSIMTELDIANCGGL